MVLKKGASLIEVVIIISIIAFLASLFVFGYMTQIKKGRDGKRRSDIEKIKVSFEDYYNDNNCYPDQDKLLVFNCGSNSYTRDGFKPWLAYVPCDPLGNPYYIETDESDCPSWYSVFTNMEYLNDIYLKDNFCYTGCSAGGVLTNYAYGSDLADLTPFLTDAETISPSPTSSPLPTQICRNGSNCFVSSAGECNYESGGCSGGGCFANDITDCLEAEDCCSELCAVDFCEE